MTTEILIKPEDLAWAAGLFEGEGCITLQVDKRNTNTYKKMALFLAMIDEDVVRKFHGIVQVGNVSLAHTPSMKKNGQKPQWRWCAYGGEAEELLWELLPHLGSRRKARSLEVFSQRSSPVYQRTPPVYVKVS